MADTKTPNADDKAEAIATIKYTEAEIAYRGKLLNQMYTARNARETTHDEFDGMTYSQYCESNRKLANAYITPKKNKTDTTYVSGTVRQKLTSILSFLNNLSLVAEVRAFNQDMIQEVTLGQGVEDIIAKTDQIDNDDEKKLARQYSMLEQGIVFIEECYYDRWVLEKTTNVAFDGKNIEQVTWVTRKKKIDSQPTRNILVPENVFLGDITIPEIRKQPFIFTVEQTPYSEAESIFGTWARWKYVSKNVSYLMQPPQASVYNRNFTLTEVMKDHVEVVKYQNRWTNEYTIFINGILMTPVGLPIPRKWGDEIEYNITSQILWLISPHFAYGKSLGSIMRGKEALLNEFQRSAILKTQLSFNPARGNLTGQVLSSRIFMPGVISNGVDPTKLPVLGESSGMTKSELAMIQEIQKGMEDDVPSNGLSAKNPVGVNRITATQSQNIKTQSEVLINLTIFAATMLEVKCGTLRMYNLLENYFEPIGEVVKVAGAQQYLEKKYRKIALDKMIPGQGPGQQIINITKENQNPLDIYHQEESIKRKTGKPTRITNLNPDLIKSARNTWYIVVNQKQKKTSDLSKVLFNEMLEGATKFFPGQVNLTHMSERYAGVWGEDPTKMFNTQGAPAVGPDGQPLANPADAGARGSVFPKSMTEAGKPRKPSINTLTQ